MITLFKPHKLRSITPDKGKEFAKHSLVTQTLGAAFYFPEPHQPWQRGTNENTNGLLKEYLMIFPESAFAELSIQWNPQVNNFDEMELENFLEDAIPMMVENEIPSQKVCLFARKSA